MALQTHIGNFHYFTARVTPLLLDLQVPLLNETPSPKIAPQDVFILRFDNETGAVPSGTCTNSTTGFAVWTNASMTRGSRLHVLFAVPHEGCWTSWDVLGGCLGRVCSEHRVIAAAGDAVGAVLSITVDAPSSNITVGSAPVYLVPACQAY